MIENIIPITRRAVTVFQQVAAVICSISAAINKAGLNLHSAALDAGVRAANTKAEKVWNKYQSTVALSEAVRQQSVKDYEAYLDAGEAIEAAEVRAISERNALGIEQA